MDLLDFPHFNREALAELGGWTVLRRARELFRAGAVQEPHWEKPLAGGKVRDKEAVYSPELDLRSLTFVRNACQCREGKTGRVCAHAVALCLALQNLSEEEEGAVADSSPSVPSRRVENEPEVPPEGLKSLRLSPEGKPLQARFWLPPNLPSAAKRNAIVVRLDLGGGKEFHAPEKLYKGIEYHLPESLRKTLAFIESLSGGSLFGLIQLKSDQLRRIIEEAAETALFLGNGNPGEAYSAGGLKERVLPLLEVEAPAKAVQSKVRRRTVPRHEEARQTHRPPRRELLPENWMVVDGSPKFLSILLRDRDHEQYRRCAEWLRGRGFRKEPSNGKWWLRDQHKVLNFLARERRQFEENYDPGYTENFKKRTAVIATVPLRTEAVPSPQGYTMRAELKADGVGMHDIRNALVSGRHYIFSNERIYLIEQEVIDKLEAIGKSISGQTGLPLTGQFEARLSRADLVHAESILDELELEAELPEDWTRRSAAIREVGRLEAPPLQRSVLDRLRSYQLIGTAWMWHLYRNQLGGILADEMGLGKTIQAICLVLCLPERGTHAGPALIVAPASLIGNWQRELQGWAPGLELYVHHGSGRKAQFGEAFTPDVVLTSYSTLRNDRDLFRQLPLSLVIADEAQHVKNRRSHASRSLRSLQAEARFVLTGTPIENAVEDLRTLFDFCLPGYLKRPPADLRGEEREVLERQALQKAAPYILRRSKREVAPELPEKIEQTVWCELEPDQRHLYQSIREKTQRRLMEMATAGMSENRMRFTMLTELLRLRQICADPGLLDSAYPFAKSGKFRAFQELLEEAIDGGHRILVFSQFVQLLKRLRTWLEQEAISCVYLDGATRDRLAVCDRFNQDESIPLCLISLKAGGTGLNLTGADTVVHFDPWWNPAVEDQATDRAHRIGQKRTVTSYKLVTEGTVEDKVLALQLKKSGLLKDLLDESSLQSAKVDLSTLKNLLSA